MDIVNLSVAELRARALTAPRYLAICYTQLAHAKESKDLGDIEAAKRHLEAAKKAWVRSKEDSAGQVLRCQRTAETIRERGLEQSGVTSDAGKHVARVRTERAPATWLESWARW